MQAVLLLLFLPFFCGAEDQTQDLCMLDKCSAAELHPQSNQGHPTPVDLGKELLWSDYKVSSYSEPWAVASGHNFLWSQIAGNEALDLDLKNRSFWEDTSLKNKVEGRKDMPLGQWSSTSLGNAFEIHILGPHSRPTEKQG